MNTEQIIAEIEWIEHLFRLPDTRLPQTADLWVEKPTTNQQNHLNIPLPRLPRHEWLEQLFMLSDNRSFPKLKEAEDS
jgi:hypothetical protein